MVPFVRPQLRREQRDAERDSSQQMAELCSAEVRNNPLGWPQITGCLLFSAQPWVHLNGLGLSPWQDRCSVIKLLLWCHFCNNRSFFFFFLLLSQTARRAFWLSNCQWNVLLVCHVSLDWRRSLTRSGSCWRAETSPTLLSSPHFHLHFQRLHIQISRLGSFKTTH